MFRKILHIVLASYMLVITTGLVLNSHYCGSFLSSISFYTNAKPCFENEAEMGMKNCCHNESHQFKLDEKYISGFVHHFNFTPDFHIVIPEYTFLNKIYIPFSTGSNSYFTDYSPPPLIADITIELQSFLIWSYGLMGRIRFDPDCVCHYIDAVK